MCTEADIHSYPMFKLFYDGEEVAKYQGKTKIFDLIVVVCLIVFYAQGIVAVCHDFTLPSLHITCSRASDFMEKFNA